MEDFKLIVVSPGKPVNVQNPTSLPLIGKGLQGAVFKLSDNQCVKIYSKRKYCSRERNVLEKVIKESNIFPEVDEVGENYIIMEYLTGPSLQEHLEDTGVITEPLTNQIIELITELKRCNFPRIDFSLRHTIYDSNDRLKIIDHVNSFRVKRSYPKRLLTDFKQLGLLASFLEHVKNIKPDFYEQWKRSL